MTLRPRHSLALPLALIPGTAGLTGCGHSPSFNVLGSYFPGWIASILAAVLFTLLVRALLRRFELEQRLPLLPLFYTALALFFACLFWLLSFE